MKIVVLLFGIKLPTYRGAIRGLKIDLCKVEPEPLLDYLSASSNLSEITCLCCAQGHNKALGVVQGSN